MAQSVVKTQVDAARVREKAPKYRESTAYIQGYLGPTPIKFQGPKSDDPKEKYSTSRESHEAFCKSTLSIFTDITNISASKPLTSNCLSLSTYADSSPLSRSNSPFSRSIVLSFATSASKFTFDTHLEPSSADSQRRPSILSRLKSSISTSSTSPQSHRRASITPSDFQVSPESPEKHFIDSIGMVIPGVTNRSQCAHPLAHFVTNWRLCEPIEYTTSLADHGITYSDYYRLIAALEDFLDGTQYGPKNRVACNNRRWIPKVWQSGDSRSEDASPPYVFVSKSSKVDSMDNYKGSEYHATNLNRLLAEISENWQKRGLPVMVCIGSFSAFAPNRLSEAHVQILHVQLQMKTQDRLGVDNQQSQQPLSFVDPFATTDALTKEGTSVSVIPKIERHSISLQTSTLNVAYSNCHHHLVQQKDRTRPWSLWPNAIPMRKRELMHTHADKYGADPYFRAFIRANVNGHTQSSSYAKWLIEQEDNPSINTRLEYTNKPSGITLAKDLIGGGDKETYASVTNQDIYEHNRRLECRKTVEYGRRLRIVRFSFRHPIYPPHSPEMDELGLIEDLYQTIISDINDIRETSNSNANCWPWLRHVRRRSLEDSLAKVREYVRHTNARQRRVVWTIEKIPGINAGGSGGKDNDWEISAWNGEDPLELLIQLERWGIIEKRFTIEDDE